MEGINTIYQNNIKAIFSFIESERNSYIKRKEQKY